MSWVEIVHTGMVGSGFVTTGAVFSPAGIQFAATVGFKVKKEEFDAISRAFHDHSDLFRNGLYVRGKKFVAIFSKPSEYSLQVRTFWCDLYASPQLCIGRIVLPTCHCPSGCRDDGSSCRCDQ
mmetsp:Transcript_51845/g.103876  ORF Transcript_51845/g.103876 Transcript_51845/m.103876 type:complete len:123 (+) Transcript_51845:177-545(+)